MEGTETIPGDAGTDYVMPPAVSRPAMVAIDTPLAHETALRSAAIAARQTWLHQFLATTDTTDDVFDRTDVTAIMLTQAR